MEFIATQAYIATVGDNHTIVLPEDIPIGAQVTITVIASPQAHAVRQRHEDFAKIHEAVQAALLAEPTLPSISDSELDALVSKARKAAHEP